MKENNNIKDKVLLAINALKEKNTQEIQDNLIADGKLPSFSKLIDDISIDPEIKPGMMLGHWLIKKKIGQGGMSLVYLVERHDQQVQQIAALKVISHGLANDGLIKRFMRERQIISDLNHQNIAKFYDAGVTKQGAPWFVMEFIEGENILQYTDNSKLNLEQCIMLFKQACQALVYAHSQGIVHRDIKPNNLMVNTNNVVKLLDFGIASIEDEKSVTMTGAVIGTPGYMSPEQAKGLSHAIDRRSDIFSLGVLLYKLIKHEMPFVADSISEISYKIIHDEPTSLSNNVPSEIQAIIFKCLEKNVGNRYSSVNALVQDLTAYLNGDVVTAKKITFIGRSIKKIKKHPVVSVLIMLAFVFTVFGLGFGLYQSFESIKKLQQAEKFLSVTQDIKAKVRLMHVLPIHNVQNEYQQLDKQIENLKLEIQNSSANDSGLSYFALGSAYLTMRKIAKAKEFFLLALERGWDSAELHSGLGLCLAWEWKRAKTKSQSKLGKEKDIYLEKVRNSLYFPAKEHLKKASNDVVENHFLAAWLAYIDEDYDLAIEYAIKEIIANPWHYEALRLASEIYLFKFKTTGLSEGYDKAVQYLDLSNEMLEKSLNIGRSDPYNHISRCTNASIDIQIKRVLKRDNEIMTSYEKGMRYCQDALILDPEARSPWVNLNLLYTNKAKYLESIGESAIEIYQQALDTVEKGMVKNPEYYKLRIYKVLPLLKLAQQAIDEKKNPTGLFSQALIAINEAIALNREFADSWYQLGRIQRTYADYFRDVKADFNHAKSFYLKAIESFEHRNTLEHSINSIIEKGKVEYDLAKLFQAKKNHDEAIKFIQQSINTQFAVIPHRVEYFENHLGLIKSYIELIQLKEENHIEVQSSIENTNKILALICGFERINVDHVNQISDVIDQFSKLGSNQFVRCNLKNI